MQIARDGDVSVTLDESLADLARRAVDAVLPGVTLAMERAIGELLVAARASWPVKTGRSRDGLTQVTVITPGSSVRVAIETHVPYTFFIKPKSLHGANTAWQRWVRGPVTGARKQISVDVGPVIVAALRGT